ncbi:uncharacterized protein LOC126734047 [Anthonomus grandis grandis]|uniref:uncharacterized protein LOC126734047 n=1 Tax=Anthonomus grandis grandis TaxID=2921223 RepID=UPI0021658F68|nr:uncharacterized protein LOC126734047 [Anthonomus grandis grandis]
MSPEKLGTKGQIIHSQGREIIANVAEFMHKEAEEGLTIPLKRFRERTLAATKISKVTYQKILKESANIKNNPSCSFSSPRKKRPRKSRILDITSTQLKEIRSIVNDFYIVEKRRPTLKLILQKIIDRSVIHEPMSIPSLAKLLKSIGFRWKKTDDNRKALMESYDIRLKRIKYLKQITEFKNQGRNIVYTDETYIHSSHTSDKGWFDESLSGIRKPILKGQRLIIVHAGGKNGFVKDGLLIFRSGSKSGDYHDDMNHENFMKWVETQLLPNLPPNSVLVLDNASYHNVQVKKNVTSGSKKQLIIDWLKEHNLEHDEKMTKTELYEIVLQNKRFYPIKCKLDELMESHGHLTLRLPPYHPELNPIEKIWTTVKNWVASRNTTFKLADVEALTRQKFAEVSVDDWRSICDHVDKIEDKYIKDHNLFDETLDSLKFTVNTGSSDEDLETSSDESIISNMDILSDSD